MTGLLINAQYMLDCQEVLGVTVDTEALWRVLGGKVGGFKQKIAVCVEGDLAAGEEGEFFRRLKLGSYRVDRTQVIDKEPHCQNRNCKYNRGQSLRLNCLVPTCPFANKAVGVEPGRSHGVGVSLATRMMQLCYRQDVRNFVIMPGEAPLESCFDVLTNDESVAIHIAYFSSCGEVPPELKSFAASTIDLSDSSLLSQLTLDTTPPTTFPQPPAKGTTSKPLSWEQQAADLAANDTLFFMDLKPKQPEPTPAPAPAAAPATAAPEPKEDHLLETLALMPEPPLPPTTTASSTPPPIPGGPSFDFFMGVDQKEEKQEVKEAVPEKPQDKPTPDTLPSLPLPLPGSEEPPKPTPAPQPVVPETQTQPPRQQQQTQSQPKPQFPFGVQPQSQTQPQPQVQPQSQPQAQPQQPSFAQPQTQPQQVPGAVQQPLHTQPQMTQQPQQAQPQPQGAGQGGYTAKPAQPEPLPANWTEIFDPNTGKPYYVYTDPATRAQRTTWERPKPQVQQPVQQPQAQPMVQPQQMQYQQPQAQPQVQPGQTMGYPQQGGAHERGQAIKEEMQQVQFKITTYTEALKARGVPPTPQQDQAIRQLNQHYVNLTQMLNQLQMG